MLLKPLPETSLIESAATTEAANPDLLYSRDTQATRTQALENQENLRREIRVQMNGVLQGTSTERAIKHFLVDTPDISPTRLSMLCLKEIWKNEQQITIANLVTRLEGFPKFVVVDEQDREAYRAANTAYEDAVQDFVKTPLVQQALAQWTENQVQDRPSYELILSVGICRQAPAVFGFRDKEDLVKHAIYYAYLQKSSHEDQQSNVPVVIAPPPSQVPIVYGPGVRGQSAEVTKGAGSAVTSKQSSEQPSVEPVVTKHNDSGDVQQGEQSSTPDLPSERIIVRGELPAASVHQDAPVFFKDREQTVNFLTATLSAEVVSLVYVARGHDRLLGVTDERAVAKALEHVKCANDDDKKRLFDKVAFGLKVLKEQSVVNQSSELQRQALAFRESYEVSGSNNKHQVAHAIAVHFLGDTDNSLFDFACALHASPRPEREKRAILQASKLSSEEKAKVEYLMSIVKTGHVDHQYADIAKRVEHGLKMDGLSNDYIAAMKRDSTAMTQGEVLQAFIEQVGSKASTEFKQTARFNAQGDYILKDAAELKRAVVQLVGKRWDDEAYSIAKKLRENDQRGIDRVMRGAATFGLDRIPEDKRADVLAAARMINSMLVPPELQGRVSLQPVNN
jgi:hypothetical protein